MPCSSLIIARFRRPWNKANHAVSTHRVVWLGHVCRLQPIALLPIENGNPIRRLMQLSPPGNEVITRRNSSTKWKVENIDMTLPKVITGLYLTCSVNWGSILFRANDGSINSISHVICFHPDILNKSSALLGSHPRISLVGNILLKLKCLSCELFPRMILKYTCRISIYNIWWNHDIFIRRKASEYACIKF